MTWVTLGAGAYSRMTSIWVRASITRATACLCVVFGSDLMEIRGQKQ
ncbi:MAG: hypothetical protein LBU70_03395 [Chitinispirillales bacterium]|nr:hypothetical protein [Chitinispirillales bacterium]